MQHIWLHMQRKGAGVWESGWNGFKNSERLSEGKEKWENIKQRKIVIASV